MSLKASFTVLMIAVISAGQIAEGYIPATLHHELDSMDDVAPSNGIPDNLESYMAGSTNLPAGYDPVTADSDADGITDLFEWVLGTDPLDDDDHFSAQPTALTNGQVSIQMSLPDYFGNYAEVYGRQHLPWGEWQVLDGWIPTYGGSEITWADVASSGFDHYFYMVFDATMDFDGDGYSDYREYYIEQTDDEVFNYVDDDLDGMHDWWELKLFGDLDEFPTGDFDEDGLANGVELVWLPNNVIRMYSDPSLVDTDGDELDDFQERRQLCTNPLEADTDGDGRDDGLEVDLLRTDPNNPDIIPPVVSLD